MLQNRTILNNIQPIERPYMYGLSNGTRTMLSDLEGRTKTQIFKVTPLFNTEYLRNGRLSFCHVHVSCGKSEHVLKTILLHYDQSSVHELAELSSANLYLSCFSVSLGLSLILVNLGMSDMKLSFSFPAGGEAYQLSLYFLQS